MDTPALDSTRPPRRREFVAFYREQCAFTWRTLLRLGVDRADCDDAMQEVFVVAHRRWHTLKTTTARRAWLFGIVRRIASRFRRTRDRHCRRIEAFGRVPAPAPDLERELTRREAWERLSAFLDALDDDKRELFVLGELEDLGRRELGLALGINPNTAYSRLQAIRREFFAHFAEHDDDHHAALLAHATLATRAPDRTSERNMAVIVALVGPVRATAFAVSTGAAVQAIGVTAVTVVITALAVSALRRPVPATNEDPTRATPTLAHEAAIEDRVAPEGTTEPLASTRSKDATPTHLPPTRTRAPRSASTRDGNPLAPAELAAPSDPERPAWQAELELLMTARRAMIEGDLSAARGALDRHRDRFGARAVLTRVREEIVRELAQHDAVLRVAPTPP